MFKPKIRSLQGPSSYIALIWLAYLLIPIFYLLERPIDEMIVGLVELAFFGMIYLHSFFRVKWRFVGVVVLLALIGYFACRYDAFLDCLHSICTQGVSK